MVPPPRKTDSDIRREAALELKQDNTERTLGDLHDAFREHLKDDVKLREKLSTFFGSMKAAAWIFALATPSLIGVVSTVGGLIIHDIRTQIKLQADAKAKEAEEMHARLTRMENLHIKDAPSK